MIDMDRHPDRFHKPRQADRSVRHLTPPITARDLRHVSALYFASSSESVPGRRLGSVCDQGDLRAAGLQDLDEAELWLARTLHTGQMSSSEDQTSKEDTEDELSK